MAFSSVTIVDTRFERNRDELLGAAIAAVFSDISIINNQFMYNKAGDDSGLGVILSYESGILIDSSMFVHNTAGHGGVLFAHNGSLHIASSTFTNNSATYGGVMACLLYTSPSPRDATLSRMPSSA